MSIVALSWCHSRRYQERMPNPTLSPEIESLPWQPVRPGFSVKLLRGGGDDDTRVQLLRLEPGTVIPRHRHTGEVHANRLLDPRQVGA